ncbi:MAG TPA: DMT family transporter [Ktedonobacteraceae bacterium]|nr:DMT family transporter [Ktedonobacteraceae bacterium]
MSLPAEARDQSEAQLEAQRQIQPRRTLSWSLLILANVLWACSYVAAKVALRDVSVNLMLALRMGIASLVLLPLLVARRGELRLTRKDLPMLALLALVGFVINKLLEYGGLALTTASDVALLIASESIFTAALSWLLLRERFKPLTGVALLLGFAGVYLIIERSLVPNIPSGGGAWRIVGDLMVVLALIFEALYTVRGKALLVKHSPLLVTSVAIVGSMVFWLPIGGWELLHSGWPAISLPGWLSIGWMAIMSTAVAYLLWFQGLAKVDGSAAASTLFIQPLLGTLLAIALLGDQLTPTTIIGGILIIVSVYVISRW